MKQVIRENCFETNSSSEHTITICNIKDKKNKEIEKGKDLIIKPLNSSVMEDKFSYTYIAVGSYRKAQILLCLISHEVETQLCKLVPYTEERDCNEIVEERKQNFYNTPIIKAYEKAIKKYIGNRHKVIIEFTDEFDPFIDCISFDDSLYEILGLEKEEDLEDITKLSEVFYNIIFNDEIEIIDKFHEG